MQTTPLAALVTTAVALLAVPAVASAAPAIVPQQTNDVDNLYPGGPALPIVGDFDNNGTSTAHVLTVDAHISSITGPWVDPPDFPCDDDDFQLNGFPVTVDADVPVGQGVGYWDGGSIQMLNLARNQNGCQAATINIEFTATTGDGTPPPPPVTVPVTVPPPATPPVPIGLTLSQSTGSTGGGDAVIITGEDFADGASVYFGDVPSPSVTVDSYGRLVAVAPPHAPGDVQLRIVTSGGTSVPFGTYTYAAPDLSVVTGPLVAASDMATAATVRCVVPDLHGLGFRRARASLRAAQCKLGHVERRTRHGRPGYVSSQWTAAGTNLPAGTKVSFTLAQAPRR
jgi:hypothetical protein